MQVSGGIARGNRIWKRWLPWGVVLAMLGCVAVSFVFVSSACASVGDCPNEALRSELRSGLLPDCRAYELVSPVYKEGDIFNSAFAISPDGSRMIVGSLGAFGGAEDDVPVGVGAVQGIIYMLSRTVSGWVTASLAPPSSRYKSQGMLDASADLSRTLWELGRRRVFPPGVPQKEVQCPSEEGEEEVQPEGVTDFYVEQPLGTFVRIGPPTPNPCRENADMYEYLGASESLSHVLFSVRSGIRWPFDGTVVGGTLYEYVGIEQPSERREPSLVGVSGGRGSTALVSRCGTRLGSSSHEPEERLGGSADNAISAGGERVFFTAVGTDDHECLGGGSAVEPSVDELLVREELPSGEEQTVPISEPSLSRCAEVLLPRCADANFEGAARDGSSVFFTSTQKLLPGAGEDAAGGDSAVTRGCSQASVPGCNLYEYDFAATGSDLALVSQGAAEPESKGAQVQGVARISEDGTHVYFVAKGVLTSVPNSVGKEAQAGQDNLYLSVRECPGGEVECASPTRRVVFVATLSPADSGDWARTDERSAITSYDGRFLVFSSVADITRELGGTPNPIYSASQIFQYDAATGGLVRVSIGQNGYNDGDKVPVAGSQILNKFGSSYTYFGADSPVRANGGQAAEDGAVFFESPDALMPQALSDQRDHAGDFVSNIYEYRAGSVYLLSDGRDTSTVNGSPGVYLAGSDPSGGDVFFFTSNSLIPQDGNTQQDIYDARVGGGFPTSSASPACTGEACLGALSGSPATAPLSGSAIQAAEAESSPVPTVPVKVKAKKKIKKPKKKARVRSRKKMGKAVSHARVRVGRVR